MGRYVLTFPLKLVLLHTVSINSRDGLIVLPTAYQTEGREFERGLGPLSSVKKTS